MLCSKHIAFYELNLQEHPKQKLRVGKFKHIEQGSFIKSILFTVSFSSFPATLLPPPPPPFPSQRKTWTALQTFPQTENVGQHSNF